MSVNVVMPAVGESVTSGVVASWLKKPGDAVAKDEPVVSIETDKATVDVPAPAAGRLGELKFKAGAEVTVGAVLATIEEGAATSPARAEAPAVEQPRASAPPAPSTAQVPAASGRGEAVPLSPAVRRIVDEKGLDPSQLNGTGPDGRVLKGDVQELPTQRAPSPGPIARPSPAPAPVTPAPAGDRSETVVPMTPIRKRIAQRLVEAQATAAILTTFNEVDMGRVMELRAEMQDAFTKKHGVKLGFMSFFVKAVIEGLKAFPSINAEIRGSDIVYKNFYDIGVAVGGGKGLVVPIIRDADRLSFATIEKAVADFGARAKDNKIKLEEMQGGTFSVTNGGIYGSMMSTPILNPPQSGILGMHNITKRAVVVNDQIVARPMMYVALSYDHRLVDGREAVSFLVRVKECIEKPERLLFEA
jgi:2-oxoglutarate dehydrogenase E2 component (dihydrolipoamide succinyltransferase)